MPGRGQRHDLSGVPVIVVENVQDYRACVPHYVTCDDIVLEAGAAQGCTTSVIFQHAAEVIGIDKSPFNTRVAQKRYPNIEFLEIDAADISALQRLNKPFTKIFLDISGSQPVGPLAQLLEKYERAFPSVNLFVVKSYRMKKLVGCSTIFPEQVLGTTRNPTTEFMLQNAASKTLSAPTSNKVRRCRSQGAAIGPAWLLALAFGAGAAVGTMWRAQRM
ncbi:hypothetical protein Vafri_3765 [Volvox africanus]|uniref:Methyltransferase domain-containing protein n=1 Tax=Volvox africanus TaxID=51714 RepID=A0A8J4AW81_9CHLO|nr:hypothetical protein Vafri_3765 [Volvox africanus]